MIRYLSKTWFWFSIFVCLQFSSSQPGWTGQTAGSSTSYSLLTLQEAIQMALRYNPKITAAQSLLDASGARVKEARSGLLPQLEVSENFTRTDSPVGVFSSKLNQGVFEQKDFEVDRLNNPNAINNFATNFTVTLPVFDSGQSWIGLSQAKLNQQAAIMAATRTRQQVIAETVFSYAGVQLAQENVRVVEQALKTARAHLKLIRSRHASGLVLKSDLLRAEVRLAQVEQERLQAQSELEIARAALSAAMGLRVHQVFRLPPSPQAERQLQNSLEDWLQKAVEHRPDLARLKYEEMMASKEVAKAKSAHLPSLHFTGNYQINTEDFSNSEDNYSVGATLSLNLYSGYNLQARVAEARARLAQMQAKRQQLELGIAVETRRSYLEAQSSWQCMQVARGAIAQAEEGLRIVSNRYKNGLNTIVNLLDAEVALQQARRNYSRARHDYTVARARLALAAGTLQENFH
ncbi:MAG: TolC family protein [Deltaproteobacteria bacterium]|nr:TolC family protein [Deltaproteobacteria bacterium]